jgi:alpha-galactosidase
MNIKTQNILILLVSAILCSCSSGEKKFLVQSAQISIEFNSNFIEKIEWRPAAKNSIVVFDPLIQPGIVVDGKTCIDFKTKKSDFSNKQITDKEFGTANEAVITGIFEDGDLKIERQTRILLPDKFKDAVIFNTVYRNLGSKKIHIDSVFSQRILVKSRIIKQGTQQADLASFQGGVNEWGRDYELIWLKPGFQQENFQGIHHTTESEFIGGGMPFVDVWDKNMGVAVMHLETKPQWLSLPVNVRTDGSTELSIVEKPVEKLGMQEWLNPSDTFHTVQNAIVFHHLDYFDALNIYGELLRCRGIDILRTSPANAYEPYWKSWGFGMNFTLKQIYNILPELRKIGIYTANPDDGWFDYYGDWNVNRSAGKFPNGEKDIIEFVKKVHKQGFKTNLWWYPLGVSPNSTLAKERPDLLVQAEDGSYPLESRGQYQFCPAYQPALKYIESIVARLTGEWGFDGLYTDARGLASVPPCYNKAHHHKSPMESFEEVPAVYKVINETLHKYNKDALHEVCICATPHSPYNMPYYQIASASDPVNLLQVRRRIKVEKAIHGPTFCVGDCYQVPKDEWRGCSVKESFESAMGTGAQVTTYYTDLDPIQLKTWEKWFGKYREMKLSSGEYLNLYDIAFDKPEIHVVRKGDELFYGIFADIWTKNENIMLRGLKEGVNYTVFDYKNDKMLGIVNGSNPVLNIGFTENLLIRVKPENKK